MWAWRRNGSSQRGQLPPHSGGITHASKAPNTPNSSQRKPHATVLRAPAAGGSDDLDDI